MFFSTALVALLAGTQFVAGHGVITAAKGDAGGSGSAIGVDPSTPRDGTTAKPFEQDTTRFKGNAADTCGSTKEGGVNDIESGTAAVLKQSGGQLPQITAGGSVQMTLHQVNSDGAGPYACMIDSTGTGTNWQNIQVTTNVAGNDKGRNPDGQAQDHVRVFLLVPDDMLTEQGPCCCDSSRPNLHWYHCRASKCLHGPLPEPRQRWPIRRVCASSDGEFLLAYVECDRLSSAGW